MAMSDPLGDMLTRIRNGQKARQGAVSAPASKLRANVLEVLKREGYIRGFTAARARRRHRELTIELKYHEGEPVIREICAGLQARPARLFARSKDLPRVYNGLGISILSTPRGVMSDNEARAANVGGESPLPRVLRNRRCRAVGKNPVTVPSGVTVTVDRQTGHAPRASSASSHARCRATSTVELEDGKLWVKPATRDQAGPHACGALPATCSRRHGDRRVARASQVGWRSAASAIARRCRART